MTPEQVQRIKNVNNPRLKLELYRAIIRSTVTTKPNGECENGKSKQLHP